MEIEDRNEILKQISIIQQNCSSVTVEIGGVSDSGMVEHESLYIKNAPPVIVRELSEMGYKLSVGEDGVRVNL